MAKIPQAEITSMMAELSGGAKDLLLYYYSRNDGWIFREDSIAKAINTSIRQLKKYRRELVNKEYLLIQKGEVDVYFIGKLAVAKFRRGYEEDFIEEPTEPVISLNKKRKSK